MRSALTRPKNSLIIIRNSTYRNYSMNNFRQTTLPYARRPGSGNSGDANSNSPQSTSKVSTPKTSSSSHSSKSAQTSDEREALRQLALDTLATVQRGAYVTPSGQTIHIQPSIEYSLAETLFYPPESWDRWESTRPTAPPRATQFRVREMTTMDAAREFATEARLRAEQSPSSAPVTIGVLNFASATKPGGGFQNGAKAQEESMARVSALYASLTTPTGSQFYKKSVREEEGATYSHAMIYSPRVVVFNTDTGVKLEEPYEISVVTSPAVNAGVVRNQNTHRDEGKVERAIAKIMTQRMARILALFENRGDNWIVLGSYGTGVFRNSVDMVANIWADLLIRDGARFSGVFERVDFAIVGRDTFERFSSVFQPS